VQELSDLQELTMKDLMDDDGNITEIGNKVNEFVKSRAGLSEDSNFVGEMFNRHNEGIKRTFGGVDGTMGSTGTDFKEGALAKYQEAFKSARSGFSVTKEGSIVAIDALQRGTKNRLNSIIGELQLPLLPGV